MVNELDTNAHACYCCRDRGCQGGCGCNIDAPAVKPDAAPKGTEGQMPERIWLDKRALYNTEPLNAGDDGDYYVRAAAAAAQPATVAKCVKCSHVGYLDGDGVCLAVVSPTSFRSYNCRCKCEFPSATEQVTGVAALYEAFERWWATEDFGDRETAEAAFIMGWSLASDRAAARQPVESSE